MNNNSMFTRVPTVQDFIDKDMFETADQSGNEMVELLRFFQDTGVPLTDDQVKAAFLLHEFDLADMAQYMVAVRPMLTPVKIFHDTINKITLADRIKGTAKLKDVMKNQVPNPSQQMPNASELQAKKMSEKELSR